MGFFQKAFSLNSLNPLKGGDILNPIGGMIKSGTTKLATAKVEKAQTTASVEVANAEAEAKQKWLVLAVGIAAVGIGWFVWKTVRK